MNIMKNDKSYILTVILSKYNSKDIKISERVNKSVIKRKKCMNIIVE